LLQRAYNASEADRGRLRLRLTALDLYLWRKVSARRKREIEKVDHLNAAEFTRTDRCMRLWWVAGR
jgi:hypothetical protein